ncbi:hypothetical protein EYF80_034617 [Liparis tanakae]|uniref:Transmembrane protein n=1 Tax=Liparis tanakae TaxID=230148 RepID=A0A4Z2GR32_9TELE|nr:hypothetical protein EYF80_034617 [Liparis tanakae]
MGERQRVRESSENGRGERRDSHKHEVSVKSTPSHRRRQPSLSSRLTGPQTAGGKTAIAAGSIRATLYLFFFFLSFFFSFSRLFLAISMTSLASLSGTRWVWEKAPPGPPPYSEERVDARDKLFLRFSFTASLSRSLALRGEETCQFNLLLQTAARRSICSRAISVLRVLICWLALSWFTITLFLMLRALLAYFRAFKVSMKSRSDGLMQAIITV